MKFELYTVKDLATLKIEATNSFNKIKVDYEAIQQNMMKQYQQSLHALIKPFFSANPHIKTIAWSQYTPYFMDGDDCIFSINDIHFLSYDEPVFSGYYEDPPEGEFIYGNSFSPYQGQMTKEQEVMCEDIKSLLERDENFMLSLFGDHRVIHITKDKIETKKYEHD